MTNNEVLTELERGFRHPKPLNCEQEMYEIMLECWKKSPQNRPTFEHLFNVMDNYHISVQSQYADTS